MSRFNNDVIRLKPKIVVILIGTNDLGNRQPIEAIVANIETMIQRAIKANIKVILCSLLPANGEYVHNHPKKKISAINAQLFSIAQKRNIDFVNFFPALSNSEGLFDWKYTNDGLHPNQEGYLKMTSLILPVLWKNILVTK